MRRLGLAACVLAVLGAAAASGAAAQPAPQGRMPLAAAERALARAGAELVVKERLGRALDDARFEVVLVERRRAGEKQPGRAHPRAADVFVYDYEAGLTRRVGVRLPTGEVDAFEELPGVQLPLSEREVRRAFEIAWADPRVRRRVQDLQRARTGAPFADPSELRSTAFVFDVRSNPLGANEAAARCGEHRCAQLLLMTSDHFAVEVIPTVDLSEGVVVQVDGF